jgi:predicted nuclease of predicted toxin-antitoxin system
VRLLLDENVSPVIGAALAAAGYDVRATVDACPGALDTAVVARASAEDRILVTEDKDFGELAFRDGLRPPGIIRLALPSYQPAEKAARLLDVLAAEGTRARGAILVIEPAHTRCRLMP